ncbi:MAG: SUMF1/EgtB/PvdO family nonheme iron enzyme [Fimbriimonadaceae bacterium]|nr:SUMF1/EgtB/PvdO family nonheme iron enzyme [Fimbriimonadaceae bacterium]
MARRYLLLVLLGCGAAAWVRHHPAQPRVVAPLAPQATPAPRADGFPPPWWPAYLAHYLPPREGLRYRLTTPDQMPQVWVAGGTFTMGSSAAEMQQALRLRQHDAHAQTDDPTDEQPARRAVVSGFWADLHHVTVRRFRAFAKATGSKMPTLPEWCGEDHPMMMVTWTEAAAYARWAGRRLITEAQHEYLGRGGHHGELYPWTTAETPAVGGGSVADEAFLRRYPGRLIFKGYDDGFVFTAPSGSFRPNAYGVLDIGGNVWSWCRDLYDTDWYQRRPERDPLNQRAGQVHSCRGGSYYRSPYDLRVANRGHFTAATRYNCLGFRLVSPPD